MTPNHVCAFFVKRKDIRLLTSANIVDECRYKLFSFTQDKLSPFNGENQKKVKAM